MSIEGAMPKTNVQLLPAYLVVGDDMLKRNTVMQRLRKRIDSFGDIALNCDTFDGQVSSGEDIVTACNTLPFIGEKRLVELVNADRLKKADREAVIAYLASPCPTTVLELVGKSIAKSTRLYKSVAALGKSAVIECQTPKRRDIPSYVRRLAKTHGFQMTPGAIMELIDLVGDDMEAIDSQLTKISLSHIGTDPVNENEVASQVSRTTEAKPWDFTDALSARDMKKCLVVLSHMKDPNGIMLLSMSVNRIRELLTTQALMRRGDVGQLASVLHVSSWRVKNHVMWARKFRPGELERALVTARDADQAMKSGSDANAAFTDWWVSVVSGRYPKSPDDARIV